MPIWYTISFLLRLYELLLNSSSGRITGHKKFERIFNNLSFPFNNSTGKLH